MLGPVSKTLEHELRQLVRRRDIVIWLDAEGTYCDFVDSLRELHAAGELPYAVKAFRGSHLELILDLETLTSSSTRHPLVVHMPTFNVETVKQTPLLELFLAGRRFERRLTTLVSEAASGKVLPDELDEFCRRRDLTLAEADAWLDGRLREDGSALAGSLRMIPLESLMDDLLATPAAIGSVASQVRSEADRGAVWERFSAGLGVPRAWRQAEGKLAAENLESVAFAAASWAMCVEYVDDLKRSPADVTLAPASRLSRGLIDACRSMASHLRDRHPSFYKRTANETEGELQVEVDRAKPEDLGEIDTFRFEEQEILRGALGALERGEWDAASDWAERRIEQQSFWLQQEPERQSVWSLIQIAASLGKSVRQASPSLGRVDGHEQAIGRYIDVGAAVDRAHRELEQRRRSLLDPRLPEFDRLRPILDSMRDVWREWADGWAKEFNRVCRDHGFLPPEKFQQRTLFRDVVVPLCQNEEPVAVFVVDGLRFEMAVDLFATMADSKATTSHLSGRLAELPTVTSVGMNALAPVVRGGRMRPEVSRGKFLGFSTGQYRVHDPESRKRAMHEQSAGGHVPG